MTKLKISIAALLLLMGGALTAWGQSLQDESIAESHIRANVPDEKDFDLLLHVSKAMCVGMYAVIIAFEGRPDVFERARKSSRF
jgi:hypothetical protein